MWVLFDKIEYNENIVSKTNGKTYAGWEAVGTKKGYQGAPDEPWSKVFFDNQTTTIMEGGIPNHNQSIVQFFLKAVKPGDTLNMKMERDGTYWRVISIENLNNVKPDYVPLKDQITNSVQAQIPVAHTEVSQELPWQ